MQAGMQFPSSQMPPTYTGNAAGVGSCSGLSVVQENMMENHQLQTGISASSINGNMMEGQVGIRGSTSNGDQMAAMMRREGIESHSESEKQEGTDGSDDQDLNKKGKRKAYHRHTRQQIQRMEEFFKECPHPGDKHRKQLGRELGLDSLQVKFWFQNKRTQMKMQNGRAESTSLRNENERLRIDNLRYKEGLNNVTCPNCGGPAVIKEISVEERHLRMENIRLKEEVARISAIATKYMGKPMPSYNDPSPRAPTHSLDFDFGQPEIGGEMLGAVDLHESLNGPTEADKPMIIELAMESMDELWVMARIEEPLWMPSIEGSLLLIEDEYSRTFPRGLGPRPQGFKTEASRECGVVMMNHINIVEILMDVNRWSTMFSSIVSRAMTLEVLSTGVAGNYNGALQVMTAEFQIPSPLVPTRECYFVRYCKQHRDGTWAVVDVSLDQLRPSPQLRCQRRPSGCLIQEMPNGYSKIIWVEHVDVDDMGIHNIYKPVVNTSLAFGAKRWISTLDRQCERIASALAMNVPPTDFNNLVVLNLEGRKSMLKLAERMVLAFCTGVSTSKAHTWTTLSGNESDNVRVMTYKSVDDPGRPPGIVLCAATSIWLPIPPSRVFDFLRDENLRNVWDILSNGGVIKEVSHIANGRNPGNYISLLHVGSEESHQTKMLLLQESCFDPIASYVVFAPVDLSAMKFVLRGGDPDCVSLLPSGFAIMPDGPLVDDGGLFEMGTGGSLLTIGFQILVDSIPTAKLSHGSVVMVNSLITCTIDRIKREVARHCP
ncbi:hypothetical protein LguiA_022693 [Lonicera macranthoides]